MSVVLLVRHGQASFESDDYDRLSPRGHEQSRIIGRRLHDLGPVTRVVHGSLRRQIQTAEEALPHLGAEVTRAEDGRFDEYSGDDLLRPLAAVGCTGADEDPRRAFQARLEQAIERWTGGEHDGDYRESYADFHARVRAGFDEVLNGLGRSQTVAVFTSGGVISALCAQWLGADARGWAALNRVGVNTGLTKFVHGRSGTNLLTVNDHAHLEGEAPELLTYR